METEQLHQQRVSRTLDAQSANGGTAQFVDNRPKQNLTGLPDNLKSGIENLSGFSMDDVRVHYNSDKPAQLQALAYTQGTDIHVAPGQEKHLPHEAWHVVQQMQGRVRPTMQLKGVDVNDEEGLEKEAERMGGEAVVQTYTMPKKSLNPIMTSGVMQRKMEVPTEWHDTNLSLIDIPNPPIQELSRDHHTATITKLHPPCFPIGLGEIYSEEAINKVVREPLNNNKCLTRMHIINGQFGGSGKDNNLRLGTSMSNLLGKDSHYHAVEQVIQGFISKEKQRKTDPVVEYSVEIDHTPPQYLINKNNTLFEKEILTAVEHEKVSSFLKDWCPISFTCSAQFYRKNINSDKTWTYETGYTTEQEIRLDQ